MYIGLRKNFISPPSLHLVSSKKYIIKRDPSPFPSVDDDDDDDDDDNDDDNNNNIPCLYTHKKNVAKARFF